MESPTKMTKSAPVTPRPGSTRFCPSLRLSEIHALPEQSPALTPDSLFYPGTSMMNWRVGKLLKLSRSGGAETFREGFDTFRTKTTAFSATHRNQIFRITTFYDDGIIPCGTRRATPRTMLPVDGSSSLELIFNYFCSRQQPGTGGLPASSANFDDIARLNRSLSLAELGRFVLVMFPRDHSAFTWNELSWIATKAKTEPISLHNWHGDDDGDPQQLNFVDWLSCLIRLALIAFGTAGAPPAAAVESIAAALLLARPAALRRRLQHISRTNGGFGAWVDDSDRPGPGSCGAGREPVPHICNSVRRPRPLQDYMRPLAEMVDLQCLLLRLNRPSGADWSPFPGPYISMVVPAPPAPASPRAARAGGGGGAAAEAAAAAGRRLRFLVLAQNVSARPQPVAFRLEGLPSARVHFRPDLARAVAPGASCAFELIVALPPPGSAPAPAGLTGSGLGGGGSGGGTEHHGAFVLLAESSAGGGTGGGAAECCRCAVFLRAVPASAEALAAPGEPPRLLPAGSLSWRAHCGSGPRETAARGLVPARQATCLSVPSGPALRRCVELVAPLPIPPPAGAAGTAAAAAGDAMLRDAAMLSPTAKRAARSASFRLQATAPHAATPRPAAALSWRCLTSAPAGSGSGRAVTARVENRLAM